MKGLSTRRRALALLPALLLAGACSDAATRVAYDIESGIGRLGSSEGDRTEIVHSPRSWPEGCSGPYAVRIEKGSAVGDGRGNFRVSEDSGSLFVRCLGEESGSHRWHTTYHLRFVEVPRTVEVIKQQGEPTILDVERQAGKATLVALR